MNLSAIFANKIFEYLLAGESSAQRRQNAGRATPLPLPWASAAEAFRSLCNGCGACAQACGSGIISMDEDGFPIVDFKQGSCTFCGDCARSCLTGALQFDPEQKPWTVAARISENCLLGSRVLCRTCGDCCGHGAIHFPLAEGRRPQILPEQCTGCGACVSVCPVGAVSLATCNKGE